MDILKRKDVDVSEYSILRTARSAVLNVAWRSALPVLTALLFGTSSTTVLAEDTFRCQDGPLQAGCMIVDLVAGGEVDFDNNHAYGVRGGIGAFVVDRLALTVDVGPQWLSGTGIRLDAGLRGRYILDIDRPFQISVGYWGGLAHYMDGPSGNAGRHGPEFSFIGKFGESVLFGMYAGLPIIHDSGKTNVAVSFLPTLSFVF